MLKKGSALFILVIAGACRPGKGMGSTPYTIEELMVAIQIWYTTR